MCMHEPAEALQQVSIYLAKLFTSTYPELSPAMYLYVIHYYGVVHTIHRYISQLFQRKKAKVSSVTALFCRGIVQLNNDGFRDS